MGAKKVVALRIVFTVLLVCCLFIGAKAAHAEGAMIGVSTRILDITDDIPKAGYARDFQLGGFELAQGEYKSFEDWYARDYPSIYVEGLTSIRKDLAVNWGVSTGEKGDKYKIDPSVKIGLQYLHEIDRDSEWIVSAFRYLGGGFREKTCTADYGSVGGLQEVNCRLAASELAPEETLKYLVRDMHQDWGLQLVYQLRF